MRRLNDSGLRRYPFTDHHANRAWLATVCLAGDLARWFQLLCLTRRLARAEPKTLRWRLWHAPARLVHHARQEIVRILHGWPDAQAILAADAPSPRSADPAPTRHTGAPRLRRAPTRAPPAHNPPHRTGEHHPTARHPRNHAHLPQNRRTRRHRILTNYRG
jgi:hypothetical protein